MGVPSLEEWLTLPEAEQEHLADRLSAYDGEGETLIQQIADRFRNEFGHLPGLTVDGPGIPHGGGWVVSASHDLVFDRRWLPNRYFGVTVKCAIRPPLPKEFEGQSFPNAYVWAPPNFERFVDRCGDEIRRRLGNQRMRRAEMLNAFIGRTFD